MLYYNRELNRAFKFISESDFDIYCLQEVSETFLKRLQTLPFFIVSRSERELHIKEGVYHNYVVILSKHQIESHDEILFPEYWHLLPLRTRLFVSVMSSRLFTRIRNRKALFADIRIHGTSVRVFNMHLILAQPAWRLKEFELAMAEKDPSKPTIVCGDFNTIEAPHISILNWLLGGRVSDVFFHHRERTDINKQFVQHELVNTLAGSVTHQLSRSQLDHILVSHSFSIKNAEVVPDHFGSDHHPICAEVE
jgi:endonuclease/exonuclease/phosphatase family metal-dependent hydrolase